MSPATAGTRSAIRSAQAFEDVARRFDDGALAALLRCRPDLADPAPRDLADLVRRAASPGSIYRAVDHLDVPALQVLRAVMAWGGSATPVQLAQVGVGPADPAVDRAVAASEGLLLAARCADGTVLTQPALAGVLPGDDLGSPLASLLEELTVDELRWIARHRPTNVAAARKADLVSALTTSLADPGGIRAVLADAPPQAVELADRLAGGRHRVDTSSSAIYPRYATGRTQRTDNPLQWLAWHGLVVKDGWYGVAMPREVVLALRGGRLFDVGAPAPALEHAGPPAPEHPGPPAPEHDGIAAAAELVGEVEAVVEAAGAAPTPLRKTGGLGVRQLRRLAKTTNLDERRVALVVELAAAAGLLGSAGATWDGSGEVLPTAAFDTWCDSDFGERWAMLARTWLAAERLFSEAGTDDDGKPTPALVAGRCTEAVAQRTVVLQLLAEAAEPAGTSPTRASLVAAAAWRAPLALQVGPCPPAELVGWVLDEAGALGLVHGDALTALGRHLVAGDVADAATLVGAGADRFGCTLVLQGDLTAVGPAVAPRAFRQRMELLADVESAGATVVHRFSEASVRRGFDAGLSADDIVGFLAEHSSTGVPQPLTYLVGDVARRHGSLRVGEARCYLRCADAATVTEVVRNRRTARLGLRAVAPTVLVSSSAADVVIDGLRAAGYLPAPEDDDGELVVARPRLRRATGMFSVPTAPPSLQRPAALSAARRLLAGEPPAATGGKPPPATGKPPAATGKLPAATGSEVSPGTGGPGSSPSVVASGSPVPADAGQRGPRAAGAGRRQGGRPRGSPGRGAPARGRPLLPAGVDFGELLPPEILTAARRAGLDDADLADLALMLVAGPDAPELAPRFGIPGGAGDRLLTELVASGVGPPCGCRRPTAIARDPDSVAALLVDAMAHGWTVRVALNRRRGKPAHSFFAEVEDTDGDEVVLWSHERDTRLRTATATLAWARVLTDAEESAMFTRVEP